MRIMRGDEAKPDEAGAQGRGERKQGGRALWLVMLVAGLGLTVYGAAAWTYLRAVRSTETVTGLRAAGRDVGGVPFSSLPERLAQLGDAALDEPMTLRVGGVSARLSRREAGFIVDVPAFTAHVEHAGKTGNPFLDLPLRDRARRGHVDIAVPFALDRARALDMLTDLKDLVDRAPIDARLDLESHGISPARDGHLLQAYEALLPLAQAARSGASEVELPSLTVHAKAQAADFADIDISAVLASWETHYSNSNVESDRTYNLKVGASKLDGHVLKPHEVFSFNEVVGDRTEKEGYRVAPVIAGGELVDGLAGGMCQIASTLHAAAFFAGLDIVSSTPHSRPSSYIPMGLDSTVVWPSVDLKLRNPYDFPVVMHYSVNRGAVRVELLGKRRPVRVVFEREVVEDTPFSVETRRDPEAPVGQRWVAQSGYDGYKLVRRRYLFDEHVALPRSLGRSDEPLAKLLERTHVKPLRVDHWRLRYPPTTEIDVIGSGSAKLKKKQPPHAHHIPALRPSEIPFGRITR